MKTQTKTDGKTSNKGSVSFKDCDTVGDEIKALVVYYTGASLGEFVLEVALEQIKKNNEKLKAFKEKLLREESEEEAQ